MLLRILAVTALLVTVLPISPSAQNANAVVAAASKAMGLDKLNAITYSGTARNGAFGQSKSIGDPMGALNVTQITQYTHARSTSDRQPTRRRSSRGRRGRHNRRRCRACRRQCPACSTRTSPGCRPPRNWGQALNIWTTPWGFLKGAAANSATVRQEGGQQVVSFSPPFVKSPSGQPYTVTGYINNQNLVTKVETRVEHAVVGDLLVEFEYSNYQNMNGVQVPGRIVQRQAGLPTFDATITAATPNPTNLAELLTPPPPQGRGAAPAAAPAAARRRRRSNRLHRPWKSSATASSRSAGTTPPSPSTWATTSWSSRAGRATRAAWR